MTILGKAGIPCGAVLNAKDIYNNEHLNQRDMIVGINHPDRGEFPVFGCPIKLSDSVAEIVSPPLLGQHTEEILSDVLGYTKSKIESVLD